MRFKLSKKFVALLITASSVSLLFGSQLMAQEGSTSGDTALLQKIAQNTNSLLPDPTQPNITNLLQELNQVPTVLSQLGPFILAWMNPDTSDMTTQIQSSFSQLGNILATDMTTKNTLQTNLNTDLFSGATPDAKLTYSSLLTGQKVADLKKDPAYAYIKNAAGSTLFHVSPATLTTSNVRNPQDIINYITYYNTVMAVESFNNYVLSEQYATGNQLNSFQQTLLQQATSTATDPNNPSAPPKNWFTMVASESIGSVMRQILLFESQAFVLLTKLLQAQQQMVAAQAMTNALLIANNNQNEKIMVSKATGQPSS